MMYAQYPELTTEDKVRSLEPLNLTHCCSLPVHMHGADRAALDSYRIEMMAGRPIVRLDLSSGGQQ
jgi:hypothetical protein